MVYVFLANGFEETEAITTIDILRRAEIEVITIGVGGGVITGSHGISVIADISESEMILSSELEMVVLPGGMPGTLNLDKNSCVHKALEYCLERDKFISAICAAPSILGRKGILKGKRATCFPGFESQLIEADLIQDSVVTDGKITTAKGAAVANEFGFRLVELLCGRERAEKIAAAMQFTYEF